MNAALQRSLRATRLVFQVQARSRFPVVYLGLAAVTVVLIRMTPLSDLASWLVPALLLGEYGSSGVLMMGAYRSFEAQEGSRKALAVTPLRRNEYLVAVTVGLALVPTLAGMLVLAGTLGKPGATLALALPLFLTATFSGLAGFALSERVPDFTRFLLAQIPVVAILSLPFLSYFGLVPEWSFAWIPTEASLRAFAGLASEAPGFWSYAGSCGTLLCFNGIAFWSLS